MTNDDTGTAVLVIILAILAYLYLPSTFANQPETLWSDGCNSKDGWTGAFSSRVVPPTWEVYTGTYYEAPASFRLLTTTVDPYFGSSIYTVKKPLNAEVSADAKGRLNYVLGFAIKLKSVNEWHFGAAGGAYVYLNDASGQRIGGVRVNGPTGVPFIGVLGANDESGNMRELQFERWYNVELVIGPQNSQLRIDGLPVGNHTTMTMMNNPPTEVVVVSYADGGLGSTEFFIDEIYLTGAPTDFPWWLIAAVAVVAFLVLRR